MIRRPDAEELAADDRMTKERVKRERLADGRVARERLADGRVAMERLADVRVAKERLADDQRHQPQLLKNPHQVQLQKMAMTTMAEIPDVLARVARVASQAQHLAMTTT